MDIEVRSGESDSGQCVAGMGLDLEPDAELRFRRPDGNHVGTGIARDHRRMDLVCGKSGCGIAEGRCPFNAETRFLLAAKCPNVNFTVHMSAMRLSLRRHG